ncbi:hypothetical protein ACLBXM_14545 [Xanthobacteraceae bacterium A53D]
MVFDIRAMMRKPAETAKVVANPDVAQSDVQVVPEDHGADAEQGSTYEITYRRRPPFERAAPSGDGWAVPDWFAPQQSANLPHEFIGYIPWIPEHSDALINLIRPHAPCPIAPIHLMKDVLVDEQRRAAMMYALDFPGSFRRLIFSHLTPLVGRIKGVIFTFDWHPFMKVVESVCADLDIPRILIPHESVFAKRDAYYVDNNTGIDKPGADIVLTWGRLQGDVYSERNYPSSRIEVKGAPKFDVYRNGTASKITREQFCRVFSFDPSKKVVLFSAQPLDSQFDANAARESQRAIMRDLLGLCEAHGWQLLVRTPPSRMADILGKELRNALNGSRLAQIDHSGFYRMTPFDTIWHSDAVVSVNSTMLFEAVLLGRPSVSAMYIQFDSFWKQTAVKFAYDGAQLGEILINYLEEGAPLPDKMSWANEYLANGRFDGQAAKRIGAVLGDIFTGARTIDKFSPNEMFVLNPEASAGNAAWHQINDLEGHQVYIPFMLNINHAGVARSSAEAFGYDYYFRWGLTDNSLKKKADNFFSDIGVSPIYVEDGFLRSVNIGLKREPGLSIILDDITPYYDATRNSRMQLLLNSDLGLTAQETDRAKSLIAAIRRCRLSKYNHAPERDLSGLRTRKRAILLVDQRAGDQSITSGLAGEDTFLKMLFRAVESETDSDIFVKTHPDAITGGKQSSLSRGLQLLGVRPNMQVLTTDINPHSLFDVVDEVWTVSSGMGFEALMAGKVVRCFGAPFYAGRGLTLDEIPLPQRTRSRSVEEVFHVAYLMLSRYYDPRLSRRCDLEDVIDYMHEMKVQLAGKTAEGEGAGRPRSTVDLMSQLHLAKHSSRTSGRTIEVMDGTPGHAFYGPYLVVSPGRYKLRFKTSANTKCEIRSQGSIVFEAAIDGGKGIVAQKTLKPGAIGAEPSEHVLTFVVPEGITDEQRKLEFRGWTDGANGFTLSSAVLERLD